LTFKVSKGKRKNKNIRWTTRARRRASSTPSNDLANLGGRGRRTRREEKRFKELSNRGANLAHQSGTAGRGSRNAEWDDNRGIGKKKDGLLCQKRGRMDRVFKRGAP